MSNTVIWGTGIPVADRELRRRITSEGDLRVTSEGDFRVAYIPPSRIVYFRTTSEGNQRVTSDGNKRIVIDGLVGPEYFQTADVTSDGVDEFGFVYETNPWQPTAQGGEQEFAWAYITLSWSMEATIRVTPRADNDELVQDLGDAGVLTTVRSTFTLAQQTGEMQRVRQVFPVPLVGELVRDGIPRGRWKLRGERLALIIESTGPLGVGELMVEGIQVEYEPVRKAIYPAGVVS